MIRLLILFLISASIQAAEIYPLRNIKGGLGTVVVQETMKTGDFRYFRAACRFGGVVNGVYIFPDRIRIKLRAMGALTWGKVNALDNKATIYSLYDQSYTDMIYGKELVLPTTIYGPVYEIKVYVNSITGRSFDIAILCENSSNQPGVSLLSW